MAEAPHLFSFLVAIAVALVAVAPAAMSAKCCCRGFSPTVAGRGAASARTRPVSPFWISRPTSTSRLLLAALRGGAADDDIDSNSNDQKQPRLLSFYILEGGMCPYAARTWMTLLELDLPFDTTEIAYKNNAKKPDWFLDINPRGKVPALVNNDDGFVIYESAICDECKWIPCTAREGYTARLSDMQDLTTLSLFYYGLTDLSDLAREMDDGVGSTNNEQQGFWKLMPTKASDRAALRLLNDHVDTKLNPAVYTLLMNKDDSKHSQLVEELEQALDVLQQSLTSRGGPYLMGKEFTLADIHVLPFFLRMTVSLRHFKNYEMPASKFQKMLEWYELCNERPAVQATRKPNSTIVEVYQRFVDQNYAFGGLNRN